MCSVYTHTHFSKLKCIKHDKHTENVYTHTHKRQTNVKVHA